MNSSIGTNNNLFCKVGTYIFKHKVVSQKNFMNYCCLNKFKFYNL